MSILTSTTINGDTLVLKGKVKWTYTESTVKKTVISSMSNIGIEENPMTMSNFSFEALIKFPIAGTYTFTYQTSGTGSVFMSSLSEVMNISLTPTSPFYKGTSKSDSKSVITIITTGDNTLMKMMLVTSQYNNNFYGATGPGSWILENNIYCLCENNTNCVKLANTTAGSIELTPTQSLLSSSSCLTINGNTLVSKGNGKWTGTNADGSIIIWYDKINSGLINSGKSFSKVTCECLLKFPVAGTYTITAGHAPGAKLYLSGLREVLTEDLKFLIASLAGRTPKSFSITTTINDEIKKLLIVSTIPGGPYFSINNSPVTMKSIDEIVYCLCDNNTLNNCTYLLPNDVVVIKGMVKFSLYKDVPKNFTHFSTTPMPDINKSALYSTTYTSSLSTLNTDVSAFSKNTGTPTVTSVISGYISFPKTEVYYWSVNVDDHCMILFGPPTMPIDYVNTPATDSIVYNTPIGTTPKINRPMQAEAGKMYRFVIMYHNSGGSGACDVKIREGSATAAAMYIPLSWISSDFTLDYSNAYVQAITSKCGTDDTIWSTTPGCAEIFNDNIANVLQARNVNGRKYSDLVISQCSDVNGGAAPVTCPAVYKFTSKDTSIVNSYCNDKNRFILDTECRDYANKNPTVNDWANKQMNYCTDNYANLTSAPCIAYYDAKANKASTYSKFCTDDNGSKMLKDKDSANGCLVNDTKNLDTNVALIKSTCNSSNDTLFGGFCNDMAIDTRLNDSITAARLNSCTDAAIDSDLIPKKSCIPYLSDPSRLNKVNTRIVSYCENGTNRYTNALCSQFYGSDGTLLNTNPDSVIQKSIDYRIYNQCIAGNKFATDATCTNLVLNDLNSYASQVTNYCNLPANIGSEFCKKTYSSLIDSTKTTCDSPPSISTFRNKESYIVGSNIVETLNNMHDYDLTDTLFNPCASDNNDNYDMKTIFMIIIAFVVISLLISLLINKIKKSKKNKKQKNNDNLAQHNETNINSVL